VYGVGHNNVITSPEVDSVRVKLFNLTVGQFFGSGGSAHYYTLRCNCCFVYIEFHSYIYYNIVCNHNARRIYYDNMIYMVRQNELYFIYIYICIGTAIYIITML